MRIHVAALLLFLLPTVALAQDAPAPATSAVMLDAVTVSGEQPGPGLWKVSRGEHVMYVLGILSPLPARMQWRSTEVESVIASSQVVLRAPSLTIKPKTNFFGRLFLLPSLISVRNLPDDGTLQSTVPAGDYALWSTLKQRYIGKDRGIERYRPIFAALELYKKAVEAIGLKQSTGVAGTVVSIAKTRGVPLQSVRYTVEIDEPRKAIKTFKAAELDDVRCFHQTLENIDKRLDTLTDRANAWATGDIGALRGMLAQDRWDTCLNAVTEAGIAKRLGLDDVVGHMEGLWLTAAEQALATNSQSFAVLPMELIVAKDGPLSKLKARGYTVVAPDDEDVPGPAQK
ncbi:uncharacterized protein YbaP (TraB family) [Luteibacter rhizovicinus]|uniref:Uncharacterized protein YbaP (TraB family) n=1 Tax=Luteibacter rhizovicinus TaxID=242606 RepID=A0A4R3YM30_9GAMM|nr:TraB/GumN family protein [Luteibacter rhizovicinus]TCV93340.1 uncharacterized protein YbaP (TraB family) [Luteibacter rhizovicinus]